MAEGRIELTVNGTLMRGLCLEKNMTDAGATFVREDKTCARYRLYTIEDRHPAMQRVCSGGAEIALEVWSVPGQGILQILRKEPRGLCIGYVELSSGSPVLGVLSESWLCAQGEDITGFGGWRAYNARGSA